MKTNLTLLLLLVMMVSCQPKKSDSTEMSVAEAAKIDNIEDCTVDTVKATAIFWIDKVETKHCKEYGFRTIKAKVLIREDGKVNLLSFAKKQSPAVETYICLLYTSYYEHIPIAPGQFSVLLLLAPPDLYIRLVR